MSMNVFTNSVSANGEDEVADEHSVITKGVKYLLKVGPKAQRYSRSADGHGLLEQYGLAHDDGCSVAGSCRGSSSSGGGGSSVAESSPNKHVVFGEPSSFGRAAGDDSTVGTPSVRDRARALDAWVGNGRRRRGDEGSAERTMSPHLAAKSFDDCCSARSTATGSTSSSTATHVGSVTLKKSAPPAILASVVASWAEADGEQDCSDRSSTEDDEDGTEDSPMPVCPATTPRKGDEIIDDLAQLERCRLTASSPTKMVVSLQEEGDATSRNLSFSFEQQQVVESDFPFLGEYKTFDPADWPTADCGDGEEVAAKSPQTSYDARQNVFVDSGHALGRQDAATTVRSRHESANTAMTKTHAAKVEPLRQTHQPMESGNCIVWPEQDGGSDFGGEELATFDDNIWEPAEF